MTQDSTDVLRDRDVPCDICRREIDPADAADKFDASPPDEYYPQWRYICHQCVRDGGRDE